MNIRMIFSALLLVILTATTAFAQDGALRGRIIDNEELPLPGANIRVEGTSFGTVSNVNGFYTMTGLPVGEHTVIVSYIGFEERKAIVTIKEGQTTEQVFDLKPGVEIGGVQVTAPAQGQVKALNQQLNNQNITNVIASDQVGKFPDANVGDALKRIPGIHVQYDQGEARFGNIRGTAPRLNSVTINGDRIPSAEAEDRTIQLDLIPSDMIQMIEVNKAVTPDMDADAIGGSVNLVLRSAPYGRRVSASLGTGWNVLANKPMLNGSVVLADRFANNKLGMIASVSYHNHQLGSDNMEPEWNYLDEDDQDNTAYVENMEVRQYYLQRVRQSYSLSLDYQINHNHKLIATGIYNHRNDFENRYRFRIKDIEDDNGTWVGEVRRQTKGGTSDIKNARLEDQRMMNFSLGGEHLFGKLRFNWTGSYASASEDRPNERYIQYRVKGAELSMDLSNMESPMITIDDPVTAADFSSDYGFHEITEEHQFTQDVDMNFRGDFELPLVEGKYANTLKFGVRYRGKTKERENAFYAYEPVDENALDAEVLNNLENYNKDNFLAGDYEVGTFITPEYLGNLDLENEGLFEGEEVAEELAGNFNATEAITAGYLMLTQNLGSSFSVVAGVRVEQTNLEYQGYAFDIDEEELVQTDKVQGDYIDILPGLHARYVLNKRNVFRFAWTNTIARPNYFDLVPYREITAEDNELAIGNPDLEPTHSMNIDVMFEHYFKSPGVISFGVFHKNITDFIAVQTEKDFDFEGNTWDKFSQPVNAGDATLTGVEFGIYRRLDFLSSSLSNLAVYGNYTFNTSTVSEVVLDGREDDLQLPGMSASTLNASLAWEGDKLHVRASFNYSTPFLDEVGDEAFFDRYYDKVTYLDFNANYFINDNWNVYLDLNNLLNQPLRYYQGISARTMQAEYYGFRARLGVKFNL